MNSLLWVHLWPLINLLGLSFFVSLAVTGFMVGAGLGDEANERSNHKGITPSAGAVGLVAGFGVATLALSQEAYGATFLCGVLFASLLGFMPYNSRNNAKIFMGDVGSLSTGFVFAIASLMLVQTPQGGGLLYFGPLLILPLLVDVFMTLLSRARRKERLIDAHRDHLYQRLIAAGFSHISVAWIYGVATLLYANIAILAIKRGLIASPLFSLGNAVNHVICEIS